MHGSVCVQRGIVYVGNHARTASVRTYDLDGHALSRGFEFRGEEDGAAAATGLAVDDDHRVWVADTAGGRVRAFTLFGAELEGLPAEPSRGGVVPEGPVDVAADGVEDDQRLLVGARGRGRRGVRLWSARGDERSSRSLRSLGDPKRAFDDVAGVALRGRLALVCEGRPRRVQVFRDDEFHFAFAPPEPAWSASGSASNGALAGPQPRAAAVLRDGRMVLALAGEPSALLLLDGAGRLLRVLAEHGTETGEVFHPSDVALEEEERDDRHTRLVVIDHEGERVQVFTVAGTCYGAFDV